MMIYIASDHAGVNLKKFICESAKFQDLHFNFEDLGVHSFESVDYPIYAHLLCEKLLHDDTAKGVLICGSGIGMSIAANRHTHIRAGLCCSVEHAVLARQHNDVNVICLGARFLSDDMALACVMAFLTTPFDGGRHQTRVNLLNPQC